MTAATPSVGQHLRPNSVRQGNLALRIWGITAGVLLIIGSYLAWTSYDEYAKTLEQEYRFLETHARFGDAQMAGSLRSINLLLQDVIDAKSSTPNLPADVAQRRQLDKLKQFPEIHYLITTDSQGQVVSAESLDDPTGVGDVRNFDASKRDYFTVHRDANPEDYYRYQLSRPFKTITNRNTITVSRAIRGRNGQFQGVALVSLSPAYFDSVLRQVLANDGADAAAVHNGFGDIIYRKPDPDKYVGKNIASGDAFKLYLRSDQQLTRYLGVTATDGVKRILVFSKVGDTNLDIGVSAQFDVVMAGWRSNLAMKGLIFVLVSGLSLALALGTQRRLLERRRSEEALHESGQRFRTLLQTIPSVAVQGYTQDGTTSYWNTASERLYGYSADEALGRNLLDLIIPAEMRSGVRTAMHEMFATGQPIPAGELSLMRKDGTRVSVFSSHALVKGQEPEMFCVDIDLTERKRMEEALRDSESRWKFAIEGAGDGLWDWNVQTGVAFYSPRYKEMFGYVDADFGTTSDEWSKRIHPDDAPGVFAGLQPYLDGKPGSVAVEFRMLCKDGGWKWTLGRGMVVSRDADGKPLRMIGTNADIDSRKQMEAALTDSEQRFRSFVENANDVLFALTPAGVFSYVSPQWKEVFGYELDETVGQSFLPFVHPDDVPGCLAFMQLVMETGKKESGVEYRVLRKDGTYVWYRANGSLIKDPATGVRTLVGIGRDISERKQAEAEILRSNAELEQFSYAISHDMRQPLRMISSYMQLLEKGLADHLDAEKRQSFGFAIDGAKRMDAMMLGLLEYSRVGRKGEPAAWIESRSVLENALMFLRPAIAEAQAVVRIEGDWPRVHASPDEILRLAQNLIGNALKFRVTGRLPEVTVTSETAEKQWRVSVADNGVGILPSQIERLFQVFQRLQGHAVYEGTGIGLALCRKIVEHHQGRIWAESAGEGQGSRFCFELPQDAEPLAR